MEAISMTSVIDYELAMSVFSQLLNKGLLTQKEYEKLEKKTAKKYGLKKGSIYRRNNLISGVNYGNMCDEEEL